MPSQRLVIGVLMIATGSVLAPAQKPNPPEAVEARIVRLQSRVANIESVRAIKRLQYAYGHYVELGLWNDFADLFADDAVTNYQQGARGKAQVRQLFFDQVGQGKLGLGDGRIYPHILFQPVVHLSPDGRTAKGRWRILAMLGGFGGSATWYSGVYENEYAFADGAWKITALRSEPKATAAYTATGWKDSGVQLPPHYDVANVTTPVLRGARQDHVSPARASTAGKGSTPSITPLANRVNELVQRAARLNDQADVTNVLDTYGYAFDRKAWDQAAELFAPDGTLELGLQGVYVGRKSIRHALDQFGPQGLRESERNDHVYLQTLVSVSSDGRTAQARGVELIFSNAPGGSNAPSGSSAPEGRNGELSEGTFENTFVKQAGAWKIQSVHFYPRMIVDAAAGWAKSAKPAPGPSKDFPPDRPPTSSYEIYPKFTVAPFHFNNPVTGKPPQYPERVLPSPPSTGAKQTVPAFRAPAIRTVKELENQMAEAERVVATAEACDAAENLIDAYGYYLDQSPSAANSANVAGLFAPNARQPEGDDAGARPAQALRVDQLLQPVIQVSRDGKTAKIRMRLLELGGTSGGPGSWNAGLYDGEVAQQGGSWKFQTLRLNRTWSAPYPGGWGTTP